MEIKKKKKSKLKLDEKEKKKRKGWTNHKRSRSLDLYTPDLCLWKSSLRKNALDKCETKKKNQWQKKFDTKSKEKICLLNQEPLFAECGRFGFCRQKKQANWIMLGGWSRSPWILWIRCWWPLTTYWAIDDKMFVVSFPKRDWQTLWYADERNIGEWERLYDREEIWKQGEILKRNGRENFVYGDG